MTGAARPSSLAIEGSWQAWNCAKWNQALLKNFFDREQNATPVVALNVTTSAFEEIAGAKGQGNEVRHAFKEALLQDLRGRDLITSACDYQEFGKGRRLTAKPIFLPHLVMTCLVASDSAESDPNEGEPISEAGYIARLEKGLVANFRPNTLKDLPVLWEQLAQWLDDRPNEYRKLVLPNVGGLTRVGYSVRLAFPNFRDLQKLEEALADEGIYDSANRTKILSLVGYAKHKFSKRFQSEYEKAKARQDADLFWAAVDMVLKSPAKLNAEQREASRTTLGLDRDEYGNEHLVVLCSVEEPAVSDPAVTTTKTELWEDWPFEVQLVGDGPDIGAQLLARALKNFPRLTRVVSQQVLAFDSDGLLTEDLAEVNSAFLHQSVLSAVEREFGKQQTSSPEAYPGWVYCRAIKNWSRRTEGELSELSLFAKPSRPQQAKIVGGHKIGHKEYLGMPAFLPSFRPSVEAESVTLFANGQGIRCGADNGLWYPIIDRRRLALTGEAEFRVDSNAGGSAALTFVDSVDVSYKPPPAAANEYYEGFGGVARQTTSDCYLSPASSWCPREQLSRHRYLGANLGQFVSSEAEATWVVDEVAERIRIAHGRNPADIGLPAAKSKSKNGNREWKKFMGFHAPLLEQNLLRDVRNRSNDRHFQFQHETYGAPALLPAAQADARVYDVAKVLAAMSMNKTGFRWREWEAIWNRVGIDDKRELVQINRAWQECGALDLWINPKWSDKKYYAVRPYFVLYAVDDYVEADLQGLTTILYRDALKEGAIDCRLKFVEHKAVSAWTPAGLKIQAESADELRVKFPELDQRWLKLPQWAVRENLAPCSNPPGGYSPPSTIADWSLTAEHSLPITVTCHKRQRDGNRITNESPMYWTAETPDGQRRWSYLRNEVCLWATYLAGQRPLREVDGGLLAAHAYLPLPLARVVNILGPARGGPSASGYKYPANRKLASELLSWLDAGYAHGIASNNESSK